MQPTKRRINLQLFIIVSGLFAFVHLFLLFPTYHGNALNAENAAQWGDFVGGYIGTLILIVSVALFYAQYNNETSFNRQSAFESRYFELIKYHRENITDIGIGEKSGRRVFVSLIREFRLLLDIVNKLVDSGDFSMSQVDRMRLAYTALYYGIGPNSTRVLRAAVTSVFDETLMEKVINKMVEAQDAYRMLHSFGDQEHDEKLKDDKRSERTTNFICTDKRVIDPVTRLTYCPFEGHQSRLGHYYRHMYQIVKYAEKHAPPGTAQDYVDILRAQLTNHEQALFCLNALSPLGEAWMEKGFVNKFGIVKNIPKDFFDPKLELDLPAIFTGMDFEYKH